MLQPDRLVYLSSLLDVSSLRTKLCPDVPVCTTRKYVVFSSSLVFAGAPNDTTRPCCAAELVAVQSCPARVLVLLLVRSATRLGSVRSTILAPGTLPDADHNSARRCAFSASAVAVVNPMITSMLERK